MRISTYSAQFAAQHRLAANDGRSNGMFGSFGRPEDQALKIETHRTTSSIADTAAGRVRAGRLGAEAGGLRTAARNVVAGSEMVRTADAALEQVEGVLTRMRELATSAQSSDGTAEQAEYNQLVERLDTITGSASFAGRALLDGSDRTLQIGGNAGQSMTLRFDRADADALQVRGLDLSRSTSGAAGTAPAPAPSEEPAASEGPAAPGPEPVKDADGDGSVSKDERKSYRQRQADWQAASDEYAAWEAENANASPEPTSSPAPSSDAGPRGSEALDAIDAALATVADRRAGLESTQDRLASTSRHLSSAAATVTATEVRIRTEDIVAERVTVSGNQFLARDTTSALLGAHDAYRSARDEDALAINTLFAMPAREAETTRTVYTATKDS